MNNLFSRLSGQPAAVLALVAVFCLILFLLRIRRVRLTPRMTACSGLMIALSILLGTFPFYRMPNGGSVTLGGMLPLMLLAFAYGPEIGMLAGFTYGLVDLVMEPYLLHPVQVLFDYPLPFMALGICGYFPGHRNWGMAAAVSLRFLFHFLSGVVFFGSYAPAGQSVCLYSFLTNLTYLLPNFVICLLLSRMLPIDRFIRSMQGGA
jgi:thiamine transporter